MIGQLFNYCVERLQYIQKAYSMTEINHIYLLCLLGHLLSLLSSHINLSKNLGSENILMPKNSENKIYIASLKKLTFLLN